MFNAKTHEVINSLKSDRWLCTCAYLCLQRVVHCTLCTASLIPLKYWSTWDHTYWLPIYKFYWLLYDSAMSICSRMWNAKDILHVQKSMQICGYSVRTTLIGDEKINLTEVYAVCTAKCIYFDHNTNCNESNVLYHEDSNACRRIFTYDGKP